MATTHDRLVAELTARWPESRVAPSLGRMQAVCSLLGDPQRSFPVTHLTGTNGKGSTAIMIEALLRSAGLRTGRYSSPHLMDATERIAIDGQPLSEERFAEVWADVRPYVEMVDAQGIDGVAMTFFEVMTTMAFAAFADAPVDVAVVEVGLGGAWDATNVADGQVAVVLPVDLDHTHLLGRTPAAIAAEKAGIIKPGAHAVLAGQEPDVAQVLLARCAEVGAIAHLEGSDFGLLERQPAVGGQVIRLNGAGGPIPDIHLPLHGAHMARNAGVALAAVEAFLGGNPLGAEVVQEGFAEVMAPGRLETVRQSPPIVLDGAHNPAAAAACAQAAEEAYAFNPLVGVIAIMSDKDVDAVLRVWAETMDRVVLTQVASTSRGMPAGELGEIAEGIFGTERVRVVPDLAEAIEAAATMAEANEALQPGVLVTGSVIAAGEARTLLVGKDNREYELVEDEDDEVDAHEVDEEPDHQE